MRPRQSSYRLVIELILLCATFVPLSASFARQVFNAENPGRLIGDAVRWKTLIQPVGRDEGAILRIGPVADGLKVRFNGCLVPIDEPLLLRFGSAQGTSLRLPISEDGHRIGFLEVELVPASGTGGDPSDHEFVKSTGQERLLDLLNAEGPIDAAVWWQIGERWAAEDPDVSAFYHFLAHAADTNFVPAHIALAGHLSNRETFSAEGVAYHLSSAIERDPANVYNQRRAVTAIAERALQVLHRRDETERKYTTIAKLNLRLAEAHARVGEAELARRRYLFAGEAFQKGMVRASTNKGLLYRAYIEYCNHSDHFTEVAHQQPEGRLSRLLLYKNGLGRVRRAQIGSLDDAIAEDVGSRGTKREQAFLTARAITVEPSRENARRRLGRLFDDFARSSPRGSGVEAFWKNLVSASQGPWGLPREVKPGEPSLPPPERPIPERVEQKPVLVAETTPPDHELRVAAPDSVIPRPAPEIPEQEAEMPGPEVGAPQGPEPEVMPEIPDETMPIRVGDFCRTTQRAMVFDGPEYSERVNEIRKGADVTVLDISGVFVKVSWLDTRGRETRGWVQRESLEVRQ